ncbi:hypothetical protein ACWGB8_17315 [Kitasatospora sp. NPDC054939]
MKPTNAPSWDEHLKTCHAWEQSRLTACRAGADQGERAYRAARVTSLVIPGEVHAARQRGWRRAGEAFERSTPRPTFNGTRKAVPLLFITPDQEGADSPLA